MTQVAPINLPFNVKTLWFDPNGIDVKAKDKVVVKTVRGIELGEVVGDVFDIPYEEVKKLKTPLKPILRIATEDDIDKAREMEALSREAMPVFKELARETNDDMHPVSVEYLLDGEKAIFYFESEERVDFRDLVKKLASHFHVRIDMHQIGVRDEARIIGGLAHCGQVVCCKRLGGQFNPVSIRMAKDQDLSLNPQKISGLCGRLMCCLRYENDAYKDFKSRSPKIGASIQTPEGEATLKEYDALRETLTLQVEDGKPVKIDLCDLETKGESPYPNYVSNEAWQKAQEPEDISFGVSNYFSTFNFSGDDALGKPEAIHHKARSDKGEDAKRSGGARRKKENKRIRKPEDSEHKSSQTRQRKRRSITIKDGKTQVSDGAASRSTSPKRGSSNKESKNTSQKLRPGYKSSSLSAQNRKDRNTGKKQGKSEKPSNSKSGNPEKQGSTHRRKRSRNRNKNEQKG